ncbi:hypothetical protein [Paracoccus ravus]|uniref:hypothetical protein n=1 Tax=Paracoccus ravus TaxID=2447760 RepID=UPI00106E3DC5|nr:hypothetical protein [Paracoccus ravus]
MTPLRTQLQTLFATAPEPLTMAQIRPRVSAMRDTSIYMALNHLVYDDLIQRHETSPLTWSLTPPLAENPKEVLLSQLPLISEPTSELQALEAEGLIVSESVIRWRIK